VRLVGLPRVGIVGGGQLCRMMIEAALPLGIEVCVLRRSTDESTSWWGNSVVGDLGDPDAASRFAELIDVATFDTEPSSLAPLADLVATGVELRPGPFTFRYTDKARQRRLLGRAGFPVPEYVILRSPAQVGDTLKLWGGPVVWKAATGGFDGRGVLMTDDQREAESFVAGCQSVVVAEPLLALDLELAVLVARSVTGETMTYPTLITEQVEGMCHTVVMDPDLDPVLDRRARDLAVQIAHETDSVGVLAVELFLVGGQLIINELAPRPHNSGHLTIEACVTSQFEQHVRAVAGLPLGDTSPLHPAAVMVNIAGAADPTGDGLAAALSVGGDHVHLYGKTARPQRKIGHVTSVGHDVSALRARAQRAATAIEAGAGPGQPAVGATTGATDK